MFGNGTAEALCVPIELPDLVPAFFSFIEVQTCVDVDLRLSCDELIEDVRVLSRVSSVSGCWCFWITPSLESICSPSGTFGGGCSSDSVDELRDSIC